METTDIDAAQRAPTRRRSRPNTTEVLEKDETELRLEKALFGDEAGFLESLSAARYGQGKELQLYDGGSEDDASSAAEEDLAGLADEDVSSPAKVTVAVLTAIPSSSSSTTAPV